MDDADDLPILGEPLAIELANTWYGGGEIDFLAGPEVAGRWLGAVWPGEGPPTPDARSGAALRLLRDAVRALLEARCEGADLDPRAVDAVNRHAAAACAHAALVDGAARVRFRGTAEACARARFATSCIEVLTGADPVRRCEGPGCTLLFVQQHRHRRFCHEGCSHRARQARYRRTPR